MPCPRPRLERAWVYRAPRSFQTSSLRHRAGPFPHETSFPHSHTRVQGGPLRPADVQTGSQNWNGDGALGDSGPKSRGRRRPSQPPIWTCWPPASTPGTGGPWNASLRGVPPVPNPVQHTTGLSPPRPGTSPLSRGGEGALSRQSHTSSKNLLRGGKQRLSKPGALRGGVAQLLLQTQKAPTALLPEGGQEGPGRLSDSPTATQGAVGGLGARG